MPFRARPVSHESADGERDLLLVLSLAPGAVERADLLGLVEATQPSERSLSLSQLSTLCDSLVEEGRVVELASPWGTAVRYAVTAEDAMHHLEDAAASDQLLELHRAVAARSPGRHAAFRAHRGDVDAGAELRVAVVMRDATRASEILDKASLYRRDDGIVECLLASLGHRPHERWLSLLGAQRASLYLHAILERAGSRLYDVGEDARRRAWDDPSLVPLVARLEAMRGDPQSPASRRRVRAMPDEEAESIALIRAFFAGDRAGACESGDRAIDAMHGRRKHRQLRGLEGLCHALARIDATTSAPATWKDFTRSVESAKVAKAGLPDVYRMLSFFIEGVLSARPVEAHALRAAAGHPDDGWSSAGWELALVTGLSHLWLDVRGADAEWLRPRTIFWLKRARSEGFTRLAWELESVLDALEGGDVVEGSLAATYHPREPWELALDSLESLAREPLAKRSPRKADKRLVWEVSLGRETPSIKPRLLEGSRATRGKEISLGRLAGNEPFVTAADRRVLAHVDLPELGDAARKRPELRETALLGLIDHPSVIRSDGTPLVVVRGEPELRVGRADEGFDVEVFPPALGTRPIAHIERSHGVVEVFERTPGIARVVRALGAAERRFPDEAGERLGQIVGGLGGHIGVHSAGGVEIAGEDRAADARVVAFLRWNGAELAVSLRVAPLGLSGPHLRPGRGDGRVVTTIDGRVLRAERDLTEERLHLDAVLDACPTIAELPARHGEARAADLETALEVLLELDQMGESIHIAWPRGQSLSVPTVRGWAETRVRVSESRDWLNVELTVEVDEDTVLGFRELLARRTGRFVELEGARFIALTEELARRLDALENLGKLGKDGLKARPVALPLIEELTRDAGHREIDEAALARIARLARAANTLPRVPRGFGAELRDYQRDGYVWLMRLAEAGLGACLADDMGLGKTIQALAVLVARARKGPALVVAPTSVAGNWVDEARRFAPGLRMFAFQATDRAATIRALGPGDVLVCTYGLLVAEQERLAEVAFDTAVFDEAHVLKNARTKRAHAAAAIAAEFHLSLSGTPIENHLGELWSLMQITVPGLLGSAKHFERRFAQPIEAGDRERARQLRALLKPFLLRRTKAQVLDELPPRTEVTLRVTPTEEEAAFYEALRRRALESLEGVDATSKGRIRVLAEITRLRQAAIDPRLIDELGPSGAKLDVLMDQIVSLREEGHRALVFTQFLGGMARVSERLEDAGVSYLSLDGGTPARERTRRIDAFQRGEADVFLMSLRAGGVGVNLTGADYVIHLDPWWNPAVEDQATARAHRIGQSRPVTMYRLITTGTIEEKILALHARKRELAEDLLSDMDRANKLDVDELLALLTP